MGKMSQISQFDYDTAPPEARAAFDAEAKLRGSVTNMKRTLLHSVPALKAYLEWYSLRDAIRPIIGDRGVVIFAHAISTENDCLLCSTFFRKALADLGLSPDGFTPTKDEEQLIAFGRAIASRPTAIEPVLWTRLKARYTEPEIVNLVAFAGLMIATNTFNSVIDVAVDDHLHSYVKT